MELGLKSALASDIEAVPALRLGLITPKRTKTSGRHTRMVDKLLSGALINFVLFGDGIDAAVLASTSVASVARVRMRSAATRSNCCACSVFVAADVDMISASTEYSPVVRVLAFAARFLPERPDCLVAEAWHRGGNSSVAHRTVNGFHAHGGTAITPNLEWVNAAEFGYRPSEIRRGTSSRPHGSAGRPGGGWCGRKVSTDVCVVGGVLDQLRGRVIVKVAGIGLRQHGELLTRVNFADYDLVRLPVDVLQPMSLRTLADVAADYPHFMLVRSAGATDLLRSAGKVTGVSARTPHGAIEVSAQLTAGADESYSNMLGWLGLAISKLPMNRDVRGSGFPDSGPRFEAPYSQVNAPEPVAAELTPMAGQALRRADSRIALDRACPVFQQIRAPQVARSRGQRPRQREKMFHRAVERKPGLKRCIWRDLYTPSRHGPNRPGDP